MRQFTIWYKDELRWLWADRCEDNGKEFVLCIPKKYVSAVEKGREEHELPTLQREDS